MIRYAALLALLAACPAKQTGTGPQQATGGCPSAKGVYVASYTPKGWSVALHAAPGNVEDYARIDAQAAAAAGVPPVPTGTLWLATPTAAPCQAKAGSYYVSKVEGTQPSASYGFELEGCAPPPTQDAGGGIVLVSDVDPSGCRFEQPQPIAARLGEMDKQKQWQRPTKDTPMPRAIAAIVPPQQCTPPGCETLWAFGEVKVNDATVAWTGAVNWLQVGAPADQCSWPSERFSGFFVPAGDGAVKVSEGQERPLALLATLVDRDGAKVLIADGPGEYATYDVAPGKASFGHRIHYVMVPPDAWNDVDNLGPICDDR